MNISIEALKCKDVTWHRAAVRNYLRLALQRREHSYQEALHRAFGVTARGFNLSAIIAGHPEFSLTLKPLTSMISAPECCAVLAALGVDFKTAVRGFRRAGAAPRVAFKRHGPFGPALTVASAYAELESRMRSNGLSPANQKQPYWFLRLKDADRFERKYPVLSDKGTPRSRPRIPSIQEDRKNIDHILSVGREKKNSMYHTGAYLRASIRDSEWLKFNMTRFAERRVKHFNQKMTTLRRRRVKALNSAVTALLRNEGRPRTISMNLLAGMAEMHPQMARNIIKSERALKETIDAANSDVLRRRLIWAKNELEAKGERVSRNAIRALSCVPATKNVNALLDGIYPCPASKKAA